MTEQALKILVVEVDFLVAQKLANEIRARGDEVIGPFAHASDAIARLDSVQAAILDVRVQDGTIFPVADTLISSGIPFVLLTAYDHRHIPNRFHGHGIYSKPSSALPLLDNLHREHDLIARHHETDMAVVVLKVLERARGMMPDGGSAERMVEAVLVEAIAEAERGRRPDDLRAWLMTLLDREFAQRGRMHLH
ncbi:response regulator [Paracoccus beibuensis]|uniref:response regulator n=1 Tax=Paracoccus beibuensis TaxID=547602 RepID=UPI00224075AD|nr:response regulator [Paracoccus beibuensis]